MTDRFRYLPCALHEALVAPDWAGENGEGGGPFPVLSNDHTAEEYGIYFVDLAHPAGWDHAVRALYFIRGNKVDESASVSLEWDGDYGCWRLGGASIDVPGFDLSTINPYTSTGRREALCRCICAALGLDVGVVFPVERS